MLSLPVAVEPRLTAASPSLQPATARAQNTTQQAFSSKPTLSAAPDWNGGSFRSFGEILRARLNHASAASQSGAIGVGSSDSKDTEKSNSDVRALNASQSLSISTQYKLPVSQVQVEQILAVPEPLPQQVSTSSLEASENSQLQAGIEKQSSGTNGDTPACPSQPKAPETSASKDRALPAVQAHDDAPVTSANNNVLAIIQLQQAEPSSIRAIRIGTAQPQSIAAYQISSAATPDGAVDSHPVSGKADRDAEVFQMDLHPVPQLTGGSDSDAAAQQLQMKANAPAAATRYSAGNQGSHPAQPGITNTPTDASPASKRAPEPASIQGKSPATDEQGQPITGSQSFPIANGTQNPGTGTPAQLPGLQGQFSLPPARGTDPNNAPTTSAHLAQASAPLDAARPIAPYQMTVRMEGGSGQVINVRFVNQGDQIQVAVRSNDPSTTAQLRQGLTSLSDDLSRIGWKADLATFSTHTTTALHDPSSPDTNPQGKNPGSALDWDQETPKRKSPAPELWEELKDSQSA